MLIDVSKPESFPREIKQCVYNFWNSLSKEQQNALKSKTVHTNSDVKCEIGAYTSDYSPLTDEIMNVLKSVDFKFFHASRLLHPEKLLAEGLHTNNWNEYSSELGEAYRSIGVSEDKIERALELIHREFNRKYDCRKPELCFFSNYSYFLSTDVNPGYDKYCQNIGGELANWTLDKNEPELYLPLKENGKNIVVVFSLPFKNFEDSLRRNVAYDFVAYYSSEYFWNFQYELRFDGFTRENVDPSQILEIIVSPKISEWPDEDI